jgi:amidohydrolase
LGFEVKTGVGGTGVVGLLRSPIEGDAVLAGFDMDALPIQEATGLGFASRASGRMHACGHDGHVAIGMGVAQLLAERREELQRHVKLVFQPAEEGLGGARAVLGDGVLNDPAVSVCLSQHLWNDIPTGFIAIDEGPVFAASDRMTCRVVGRGGHAAMPHQTRDVIAAASAIVSALQTVVSRNVPPTEHAVVSVTSIAAGDAFNVMPDLAVLKGTIRTYSEEVRGSVWARIEHMANRIADAFGCAAEVTRQTISPVVNNDADVTARVRDVAKSVLGEEFVLSGHRLMVSEDMGYFLAERPGCYFVVGAGPPDDAQGPQTAPKPFGPHHSATFGLDERALPIGAAAMSAAVIDLAAARPDDGLPGESAA